MPPGSVTVVARRRFVHRVAGRVGRWASRIEFRLALAEARLRGMTDEQFLIAVQERALHAPRLLDLFCGALIRARRLYARAHRTKRSKDA